MARITHIKVIRTRATATWVIVKVFTDQPGLYGIGSAHDYNATGAVVAALEEWMAPRLIGRDPAMIEDIWQSTFTSGYWRTGPTLNAALAGIDIALDCGPRGRNDAHAFADACKALGVNVMTLHWEATYGEARVKEIEEKDFAGHIDIVAQNIKTTDFEIGRAHV